MKIPALLAALLLAAACATGQHAERPAPAEPAAAAPPSPPTPPPPPQAPRAPAAPPPVDDRPVAYRPLNVPAPLELIVLPSANDPIVNLRLVFRAGSVDDPDGKEGLTALAAALMKGGGTVELTSAKLLEALFPLAGDIQVMVSEELTTFSGRVHRDHVERFLQLFADVVARPRWDPREFERLRTDAVNAIKNQLRSEDDEQLGKVALASLLYRGHPYGTYVGGTVKGLRSMTVEEVRAHAARVFTQDRLVIGLGGAVDDALGAKVRQSLAALPATGAPRPPLPEVSPRPGQGVILKKPTLSTAISLGYPYALRRGDPDFHALVVALSYLGEHRQSTGVLFNELREKRGMNYGNYAYAEHFVEERGETVSLPNVGRAQQYLSIWIRPVEPQNAVFAVRGALHFLQKLHDEGIPEAGLETTRGFLRGYTRVWDQTQQRRLGYAIDDRLYGTEGYLDGLRGALETLTREQIDAAVRRHLDPRKLSFAFVTQDAEQLKANLASGAPSPVTYPTPKAPEVLEEDKQIIGLKLPIDPAKVEIVPASSFMEQ